MSKNDTFHSFRELDVARFRDGDEPQRRESPPVREMAAPPEVEDESALFLEAVSGNIDVSLKRTPDTEVPATAAKSAKNRDAARQADSVPEPQTIPSPPRTDEFAIFSQAMDGVRPIRARGRDLAPAPQNLQPVYTKALADMDDIFSGKLEFSLEHTDEFIQGHVLGLDPFVIEKLKAGAYSPEGHIDLHGQNMEQAYAALTAFIRSAYQSGKRHLIVITGRGKNSPGGMPVLRERVQAWFTRDPFKRVVLGFCSAKPGDGGAGALYLLLRKRKKSQGKIVWDKKPTEEELLL